jgi:hypothetical protein
LIIHKVAEDPEGLARQLLEVMGTDAMEDWMDQVYRVWSDEGSHK